MFEVTLWKNTSKAALRNCPGTWYLVGKDFIWKIAMTVPTQWGNSINSWESLIPDMISRSWKKDPCQPRDPTEASLLTITFLTHGSSIINFPKLSHILLPSHIHFPYFDYWKKSTFKISLQLFTQSQLKNVRQNKTSLWDIWPFKNYSTNNHFAATWRAPVYLKKNHKRKIYLENQNIQVNFSNYLSYHRFWQCKAQ